MKTLTFNKLALAVAFTGGALVGCDSGYDTKAVNTEKATTQSQGDFVKADMTNGAATEGFQLAQYDDNYQTDEMSDDDIVESQEDLPGSVEERTPGADGSASGVPEYNFRSTADQSIHFEFDSAELTDEAKDKLKEFIGTMNQDNLAAVEVAIKGYTDTTGPEEYNQDLAERRAEAVRNFLEEQGLASYNLQVEAIGEPEEDELAENAQENRRVVVSVEAPYEEDEIS